MLGLFVAIDLLILMVWEIIDPLYATKNYSDQKVCIESVKLAYLSTVKI